MVLDALSNHAFCANNNVNMNYDSKTVNRRYDGFGCIIKSCILPNNNFNIPHLCIGRKAIEYRGSWECHNSGGWTKWRNSCFPFMPWQEFAFFGDLSEGNMITFTVLCLRYDNIEFSL